MQKITIVYEVYTFDELTEDVKNSVISDLLMSIMEVPELYPELEDEIAQAKDKVDRLYTPWFFTQYLWEFAEGKILQILQEDVYLADGKVFKIKEESKYEKRI